MPACTFFGHRDGYGVDREALRRAVLELIEKGVDTFYVGDQGCFDGCVRGVLRQLQKEVPHIRYAVVLAYHPGKKTECGDLSDTMYPEGMEGHPKYAIERRNRWLVNTADYVICHIRHPWGGAYKFACLAAKQGKQVIDLGGALDGYRNKK